jgi:hypothetical protein
MTTTSDPVAHFGRQARKERTARGWNLHEFGQQIAYHPPHGHMANREWQAAAD